MFFCDITKRILIKNLVKFRKTGCEICYKNGGFTKSGIQ